MEKILLVTSFLILIVTLIKCFYTSRRTVSEIYLCVTLFGLLITSIVTYLSESDNLYRFIHFYRMGAGATYIFVASSFLYIQKSISKKGFKALDLIFFIPALLYFIDMAPFIFQSAEAKRISYMSDRNTMSMTAFRQSWIFPHYFHLFGQNLYGVTLSLCQFVIITRFVRKGGKDYYKENSTMLNWFYVWAFLLFMSCFPDLLGLIAGRRLVLVEYWFFSPCLLVNLIYPLSLLISPKILYGIKGIWMEDESSVKNQLPAYLLPINNGESISTPISLNAASTDNFEVDSENFNELENTSETSPGHIEEKVKKVYYPVEDAEELKTLFDEFMLSTKAFLDIDYSINRLAKDNGCSVRLISSLLNDYCNISFKDYINTYRIQYFIDKYQNEKESQKMTMEGLAKECGFNSRFTFIHAFKKINKKTPSEFFGLN